MLFFISLLQILMETAGLHNTQSADADGVCLLAATNLPGLLDDAILRRLQSHVYNF